MIKEYTHKSSTRSYEVREYDLTDFLDDASKPVHKINDGCRSHKEMTGHGDWSPSWRGISTPEAAMKMRSWPEGRDMLHKLMLDEMEIIGHAIRRKRIWSDDGDEFDRDRLLAGVENFWQGRAKKRKVRGGRIIRFTIERTADCGKSAEQLIWTGIAAASLADALEEEGYRIEIDAMHSINCLGYESGRDYHNCVDIIRMKDTDQPLNIDSLLVMAHSAFLRYFCFMADLRRPFKVCESHGSCINTPEGLRGDIHLDAIFDRKSAEKFVNQQLSDILGKDTEIGEDTGPEPVGIGEDKPWMEIGVGDDHDEYDPNDDETVDAGDQFGERGDLPEDNLKHGSGERYYGESGGKSDFPEDFVDDSFQEGGTDVHGQFSGERPESQRNFDRQHAGSETITVGRDKPKQQGRKPQTKEDLPWGSGEYKSGGGSGQGQDGKGKDRGGGRGGKGKSKGGGGGQGGGGQQCDGMRVILRDSPLSDDERAIRELLQGAGMAVPDP